MLTFGDKLRIAREENNITQKELAEKIGKKRASISDWENNNAKPDYKIIEKLCSVLKVSPTYFLDFNDNNSKIEEENAAIIAKLMISQSTIDMMGKYFSLDPPSQRTVQILIECLLNSQKK